MPSIVELVWGEGAWGETYWAGHAWRPAYQVVDERRVFLTEAGATSRDLAMRVWATTPETRAHRTDATDTRVYHVVNERRVGEQGSEA